MAPNMSLGVNLLLKLVELTAGKLDASYDIEVFEAHHRNKKDAPSGTALALGAAAAAGRGVKLSDVAEYARHGDDAARARAARSASRCSAAAMWSAITRSRSPASASASS